LKGSCEGEGATTVNVGGGVVVVVVVVVVYIVYILISAFATKGSGHIASTDQY
jgi:hypothetical protein